MTLASGDDFLRVLGARPQRSGAIVADRAYFAYPNLANARWLLPADPRLRTLGLQLYAPQRLRGRLLKRAIASGALRGERVVLEGTTLRELEAALGQWVGEPDTRLAFSLGTPGASRKATAQLIGRDERVLAYAKIAMGTLAQEALDAEWRNLRRVSAAMPRGRVPEPIHVGTWRETTILLMSAGPTRPGPADLGEHHLDFLLALHDATRLECEFGSSPMFTRLRDGLAHWGSVWRDPWPDRFARVLTRLEVELGPVRVPLSFAHRDFAPWNTRAGPAGLFVLDWEMASDGMVPLYDAFHFDAIQAATRNAPVRNDDGFSVRLLAALWPTGAELLPLLYLAYLADVSLLYGEARARAPDVGEDGVWLWFGSRIDEWLAVRT